MMFIKRQTRRSRGQAAVEAMFSIPVMMLVFAIGCTLFNITYNAQYAHVKARSKALKAANHMPCEKGDGRGVQTLRETMGNLDRTASATTDARNFVGIGRMDQPSRTMKAKATIVCK